jgi:hypothetical protein
MALRSTIVVDGPLALRMQRVRAARERAVGREILTLPILAARLVGGFTAPAGTDVLYPAIQVALAEGGFRELASVAELPGTPHAVLQSLDSVWRADIELIGLSREVGRLADLALIEERVRRIIPPARLLPRDLRDRALASVHRAGAVLGPVKLVGVIDVDRPWQPLLNALAGETLVIWEGAIGPAPAWFEGQFEARPSTAPAKISAELCADPRSEVIEALRWARELLASGTVKAEDIAIAATSPQAWDDHFLVLARNAQLPVHFSHGIPALSTPEGQACAALADILTNGLSQERVWRLIRRLPAKPFAETLPEDWFTGLPRAAVLTTVEQWRHALAAAAAQRARADEAEQFLLPLLALLAEGPVAAQGAGFRLLSGASLTLWEEALRSAPPHAIGLALGELRVADGRDPGNSIVWCPAPYLTASPRPWTRLLGLTSHSWPRAENDDPLLPHHLLPRDRLHPIGLAERKRESFNEANRRLEPLWRQPV